MQLLFAMKLDRLCISRSSTFLSGVVEISQKVGKFLPGPLTHTHTQIQHLCKPFSRKGNCKQQEKESKWKKATSGLQIPEPKSYLRSRVAVEKAARQDVHLLSKELPATHLHLQEEH